MWLRPETEMETEFASGTLRVKVRPVLAWKVSVLNLLFTAWFLWIDLSMWYRHGYTRRALTVLSTSSAIALWFYLLVGRETFEFSDQKMSIRREVPGWTRTSEYELERSSKLRVRTSGSRGYLMLKVGWRTINLSRYLSAMQAVRIVEELVAFLPLVAMRLVPEVDGEDVSAASPRQTRRLPFREPLR